MNIKKRIEEYYQGLTKKQKSVADFIREHIEMMSFITLKEMSQQIGVTEITILNTCQSLGYDNFNELKYECRKMISEGSSRNFTKIVNTLLEMFHLMSSVIKNSYYRILWMKNRL